MIEFFGRGGRLKPSWYGDCLPSRDFPLLVDLYLQGRLDLDGFVSETIALDGVEEAFHRMERGEVLRSVVRDRARSIDAGRPTTGIFSLDGQDFEVENNVWLVGDDDQVLVIDAAHDHRADRRGRRRPAAVAIVATHGHNDHINAAERTGRAHRGTGWLHPDDLLLWDEVYPDRPPDRALADGTAAPGRAAPPAGHSHPGPHAGRVSACTTPPAAWCSPVTPCSRGARAPPGASFSDFPTIIESIRTRLLDAARRHAVHPGHGADTHHRDRGPPSPGVDRLGATDPPSD